MKYLSICITYFDGKPWRMVKYYSTEKITDELKTYTYTDITEAMRELLQLSKALQCPVRMEVNPYDRFICDKCLSGIIYQ